jgi:methylthioribose-1-phosphate isomerase
MNHSPIEWLGDRVRIIDQTCLPAEEVYMDINNYHDLAAAIKELKVRGAPVIGIAGAYAAVLGVLKIKSTDRTEFLEKLNVIIEEIAGTRPTARNLFFALERLKKIAESTQDTGELKQSLIEEAISIHQEEAQATEKISQFGLELIRNGGTVLTHCNAGPLATAGYGTALGIIIKAKEQGINIRVLADETRPLLQGARLTTWEMQNYDIPVTLITDSMAGYFMKAGKVDCVITGADRVAANGDTANKIGTYTLAVLAKENNVPFYIAAPASTIDISIETGEDIPIEERSSEEVTHFQGIQVAPEGISVANPAFDVTPHHYISAIVTDKGIVREPYSHSIHEIFQGSF